MKFNALLIKKNNESYRALIKVLNDSDLPVSDVIVHIDYSQLLARVIRYVNS